MKQIIVCAILFLVFVTAGALTAAATKVSIQQILGPGASTAGTIFGWLTTGAPAFLKLGTNLSIDASGNLNAASATIPASAFVDNATIGTGDGTTTAFTLPSAPNPSTSLKVFIGGVKQFPGTGNDYTISGATLTFLTAPFSGASISGDWRTAGF